MRPVVAAPREDLHRLVGQVDLDAIAVEFDFVDPAASRRHLPNRGRECGLDESGQRRLDADRLGFPTLKRHQRTPRNTTADSNWYGRIRSGTRESLLRCFDTVNTDMEETTMAAKKAAKKTTRGRAQDRAKVAGGQKYEVDYEAKKTGRSASAVKTAVKKVGNVRGKVEKKLVRKK